jgi:hypothetical protein
VGQGRRLKRAGPETSASSLCKRWRELKDGILAGVDQRLGVEAAVHQVVQIELDEVLDPAGLFPRKCVGGDVERLERVVGG